MRIFKVLSTMLALMTTLAVNAETLTIEVASPGSLTEYVKALQVTPTELIVKGVLNSEDLKCLNQKGGALYLVENLNLKDVTILPDGKKYAEYSRASGSMGASSYSEYRLWPRDSVSYEYKVDGTLTIYWGNNMAGMFRERDYKRIVLPESLPGLGSHIFSNCSSLENVGLPSKAEYIADYAFYGCENLPDISLPASVDSIGESAFASSKISEIDLSHVGRIGVGAFEDTLLEEVELSERLKDVPSACFENCVLLKHVVLSPSTISIGFESFARCVSLKDIEIPETVMQISADSFLDTPFFNAITPEKGVVYIGKVAVIWSDSSLTECVLREGTKSVSNDFGHYHPFTSITLPQSLVYIGSRAFKSSYISKLEIPESVEYIGEEAFKGCIITEIVIPTGVKFLGTGCFICPELKRVVYNAKNARTTGGHIFEDFTLTSIIFGDEVESIPAKLFYSQDFSYSTFQLPQGLKRIGSYAFSNCSGLSQLILPPGVEYIGEEAFWNATLENVVLPSGLRQVGNEAFGRCKIKRLELNCAQLEETTYIYVSQFGNSEIPSEPFYDASIGELIIGSELKNIPSYFFCNSDLNGNVYLENGISIGKSAFKNTKIESLRLPDDMLEIPDGLAEECYFLKSVSYSPDLTKIGDRAFFRCYYLDFTKLPEKLEHIGAGALSETTFGNIILPPTIKTIGAGAFRGCNSTYYIFIPAGVEYIGGSAFADNTNVVRRNVAVKSMMSQPVVPSEGQIFTLPSWTDYPRNMHWTLVAPEASMEDYKKAPSWDSFETFISDSPMQIDDSSEFVADLKAISEKPYNLPTLNIGGVYCSWSKYTVLYWDSQEPCIQFTCYNDEATISNVMGKSVLDYDLNASFGYEGLIIELPVGKGVLNLDLCTYEDPLTIRIGDMEHKLFDAYRRKDYSVNYEVASPTYAYIYKSENISNVDIFKLSIDFETNGIESIDTDGTIEVIDRYNINGQKVTETYEGFVIERMSNGSVRKVMQ